MANFVPLAMLLLVLNLASADVSNDRADCTQQLVGMATCLPYVQGDAKSPTPDCCTGLKSVIGKSPKCLCVLVRDRDDPNLGFKINLTLALALPSVCSTPANVSKCPKLLKLPPGSPEAEVFEQPTKAAEADAASRSGANGNKTNVHQSSGGRSQYYMGRNMWLEVEMIGSGILLLLLMPLMVINV